MFSYQVIPRKYRPQFFREVVGQKPIIGTLLNALRFNRAGHAYLFSGSQGTGKTTLARLFAKALNCEKRSEEGEPCNLCPSCIAHSKGNSFALLEIDGASNRGIEEIRRLQESVGLTPAVGKYKIYLIDEVHMLTKEAFNALLKTLEEPPSHVKFFFATTESEKIPSTIVSRCQRFQLSRLAQEEIERKLESIALDLGLKCEKEAIARIAKLAAGSLRDAEVLLDELYAFYGDQITLSGVENLFGLISKQDFNDYDKAVFDGNLNFCSTLIDNFFKSGRSPEYFLEELIEHYRNHLSAKESLYSRENLLDILELLQEATHTLKSAFSPKSSLELLLLRIARIPKKMSYERLLARLEELEKRLGGHVVKEEPQSIKVEEKKKEAPKGRYDTLMRFTAKELQGTLKMEPHVRGE